MVTINVNSGQTYVAPSISDTDGQPGSLTKDGLGDLISLNATYSGSTTIALGRLFADGPLGTSGQNLTIASDATLGGSGPISGLIANSGVLTPSAGGINTQGVSIPVGTEMTINGSVTQEDIGSTEVYFSPTQTDKINVIGGTIEGGSVYVTPAPGYYPQTPITYNNVITTTGAAPTVVFNNPFNLDFTQAQVTGTSVTVTGGGDVTVSGDNSDIQYTPFTTTLESNVCLIHVTGRITLENNPTLSTSTTTANTIGTNVVLNDSATVSAISGSTVNFTGALSSGQGSTLALNTGGTVNFTGDSPDFQGTISATNGTCGITSNYSNATVSVYDNALLTGSGTIGMLNHYTGGNISPGNAILNVTGNYNAADTANYYVTIDPDGGTSKINVTGNATLATNYTVYVLMSEGNYAAQTTDYTILTAQGGLTGNVSTVNWIGQSGLNFNIGVSEDGKSIILKSENTNTNSVSILQDQTIADIQTAILGDALSNNPSDVVEVINVGDYQQGSIVTASVMEQPDFTVVFNKNDAASFANTGVGTDNFRFKAFKPSASNNQNLLESLLKAVSSNGPINYEKNETRLWITPYVNRSRSNRTSSAMGNQGWAGGSLVGIEQRDSKNNWTIGLMTGAMGSRSHVLGVPDTFSKTKGMLFGSYNTYKYTDQWSHELLATRTYTYIDAQRFGTSTTTNTPFYALSSYKSITDVGNAQLNYLFDIIKKDLTCRLDTGFTYQSTTQGQFMERNGSPNLFTSATSNTTNELYGGVGFRKTWNHDQISIRSTFVYEYGYQLFSRGTPVTQTTLQTTQSNAPSTFTTPVGPRQNKHYIQFNNSYLDRKSGLKFITSYSGKFYKNVQNNTVMFKVEYRF